MSDSSPSTRQRSVDSDTSLAPDPKRKKSLDTQRAFRARKAAHVKDLEVKVALQELEIARLRRENAVLQADIARLGNGAPMPNATCCPKNPSSATVNDQKSTHPSVLQPMPSVMRTSVPEPPVSRALLRAMTRADLYSLPVQTASIIPTAPAPLPPVGAQKALKSVYGTSSLPVVSSASQPRAIPSSTRGQIISYSGPNLSDTQTPAPSRPPPLSITSSTTTSSESVPSVSASPAVALTRVVCCNNMFTCEDDNESEARWLKQNTGIQGIGSNTMDDFYALFGGESGSASTAGNGQTGG